MALQGTDVFIVSDASGTNYKVSYTDLIAKLQADGLGGDGGGMGNILRFYSMTQGSATFTHGADIPPEKQHIAYNTTVTYGNGSIELTTYKWGYNSYVYNGSTQYGTHSALPKDVTPNSFLVYVASRLTSSGECTISY